MRIVYLTQIKRMGNSLAARAPREVRNILQINEGDWVRIEIEKVEINDANLHVNDAARQDPEARD